MAVCGGTAPDLTDKDADVGHGVFGLLAESADMSV